MSSHTVVIRQVGRGGARHVVVVIVQSRLLIVSALVIASCGSSECVELLSCIEHGTRFHERRTVVCHAITVVRIFLEENDDGGDHQDEQQDQGHDGVEDPQKDTNDSNHETWTVEDIRHDQQENGVQEVDNRYCHIYSVGRLVHVRPQHAGSNEGCDFDDDQSNSLRDTGALTEGDEHGLKQRVQKDRYNEVVG